MIDAGFNQNLEQVSFLLGFPRYAGSVVSAACLGHGSLVLTAPWDYAAKTWTHPLASARRQSVGMLVS